MGTNGGEISVRLFVDVLCPDSLATYNQWKDLLLEDSPVFGKTYGELVDLRFTPFVLPWHIHGYTITQIFPYLDSLCDADETQCYQIAYAEYAWKNMADIND